MRRRDVTPGRVLYRAPRHRRALKSSPMRPLHAYLVERIKGITWIKRRGRGATWTWSDKILRWYRDSWPVDKPPARYATTEAGARRALARDLAAKLRKPPDYQWSEDDVDRAWVDAQLRSMTRTVAKLQARGS